jgi:hypothetical protein
VPQDDLTTVAHVIWIGGSPCAGKTSVAQQLADRHSLQVYHFDRHEADHIKRSSPARHPALHTFLALTLDERWVLRSPREMARNVICSWTERFDLVLEDLRALPRDPPIVAEGAGLFPALVAPLLARPHQAIWLVPTAAFCATMRRRRGSAMPAQTSDPERAWRNLIDRDVLLARYVRQRAAELGSAVVEIDGSRSIDEVAVAVAEHVGLGLSPLKDRRNSSGILHLPR